jgi:hypothetical protein
LGTIAIYPPHGIGLEARDLILCAPMKPAKHGQAPVDLNDEANDQTDKDDWRGCGEKYKNATQKHQG